MAKKATTKKAEPVDFSEGDGLMVDLNLIEDSDFEVLPKGMYPVIISDCEFTHSQASGNPMWTLTMEVADGEYAGQKLWSHLVFAGKGLPMTKRTLGRIASELFKSAFDPEDVDVINSMLGKELRVKVDVRMYDGRQTNNVRDLFLNEGGNDSFTG